MSVSAFQNKLKVIFYDYQNEYNNLYDRFRFQFTGPPHTAITVSNKLYVTIIRTISYASNNSFQIMQSQQVVNRTVSL